MDFFSYYGIGIVMPVSGEVSISSNDNGVEAKSRKLDRSAQLEEA